MSYNSIIMSKNGQHFNTTYYKDANLQKHQRCRTFMNILRTVRLEERVEERVKAKVIYVMTL